MNKCFVTIFAILMILSSSSILNDDRTQFFPKVELKADIIPEKQDVWVFIMAGQSNMEGRGLLEAMDTIPHPRILSINDKLKTYVGKDSNSYLVKTSDLFHKGDSVHFDSDGQRKMGERIAERFIETLNWLNNHLLK